MNCAGDPDKDEEGPRLESSLSKDSHSMNDLRLKEKRKGMFLQCVPHHAHSPRHYPSATHTVTCLKEPVLQYDLPVRFICD